MYVYPDYFFFFFFLFFTYKPPLNIWFTVDPCDYLLFVVKKGVLGDLLFLWVVTVFPI